MARVELKDGETVPPPPAGAVLEVSWAELVVIRSLVGAASFTDARKAVTTFSDGRMTGNRPASHFDLTDDQIDNAHNELWASMEKV